MGDTITTQQQDPSAPVASSQKGPTLDARIEQCISQFGWPQLIQSVLVSLSWAFEAQQCFISVFTDSVSSPSNILTDFSLQDATPFVAALPASSFFLGSVAGALLLTPLADSCLGRKKLLLLSCLLLSLSALLTAFFATSIYSYSALRFLGGLGRGPIGGCALVLSGELVGQRWRSRVGIIGFVLFSVGFASLPAIAYVNRDSSWRRIYLWTSLPALLYTLTILLFVKESPRWLFIRGCKEEAVKTLQSILPMPDKDSLISLSFFSLEAAQCKETSSSNVYSAMRILVSRRWSSRRLLLVMEMTLGLGNVYYGMPLGLGNLSFNLYLSVAISAFMELPASLATFLLVGFLNRKPSLIVTAALSGFCSILCGALTGTSPSVQVALELLSFLSGTTALDMALIYTTELFPTCVRNSAMSLVRVAAVFGGAFGPVLAAAGRRNKFMTYGAFGVVIMVCGVFAVWLPETRGTERCDTMDEEESKLSGVSAVNR